LIEIGSKTAEKNSAQTNKQTDTTKIMVTWPWTNNVEIRRSNRILGLTRCIDDDAITISCCYRCRWIHVGLRRTTSSIQPVVMQQFNPATVRCEETHLIYEHWAGESFIRLYACFRDADPTDSRVYIYSGHLRKTVSASVPADFLSG